MIRSIKNIIHALRESVAVSKLVIPFFLIIMIFATLTSLVNVFLIKYLSDYATSEGFQMKTLLLWLLLFFALDTVYYAVCRPLRTLFLAKYEIRVMTCNMSKIYRKCTELDLSSFDQKEFYDKLNRAINESAARYFIILCDLSAFFPALISFVTVFSFYHDALLILAVVIFVSLHMTYYFTQNKKRYEIQKESDSQEYFRYDGYLNRIFSDRDYAMELRTLPGVRDILTKKYDERNFRYRKNFLRYNRMHACRHTLLSHFPFFLTNTVASIYISSLFFDRSITSGDFLLLIGIVSDMSQKLVDLLHILPKLYESSLYVSDIREILDYPTMLDGDAEKAHVDRFESLEFRNVSFHYGGEGAFALHDLSFSLKRGEIVALVGLNGAGKSTIVDCIMGLLKTDGGQILLNGRDYGEYRLSDIQSLFGIVFQDFRIYELSVAENVLMRRVQSQEDEALVHEALRYAGLYDKILSLEDGIDTVVSAGDQGSFLSGGEQQLLAIARAYAKTAPVILFDEPTSALDVYMTNDFYEKLFRLREKSRTILFTSHKLKHVHRADKIIFAESGTVAETGSHEELIARGGRYAELYRLRAVDFFAEEAL